MQELSSNEEYLLVRELNQCFEELDKSDATISDFRKFIREKCEAQHQQLTTLESILRSEITAGVGYIPLILFYN